MYGVEIACEKFVTTINFYLDSKWNEYRRLFSGTLPVFFSFPDLLVFSSNVLFHGLDSAVI